jgi:hypothetical protein
MTSGNRPLEAGSGESERGGVKEVTATVIVNAPAERVFTALTAWERQDAWLPFTTVKVTHGDGGVGSIIEAVTTIGPAVLTDVMRVEQLDRPYQVKVMHTGKILRGPGVMRCTAMGPDRTQVVWHEWFQMPGGLAGRLAWPLVWPGSKAGLTGALKRFARLVEDGSL